MRCSRPSPKVSFYPKSFCNKKLTDAGEQITKEEAKQRRKVFSEVRRQQIGLSLIKTKEKETKEKETKDKSRSAQTKSKMTRKRNARETFQYDESEASDVEEDVS